MIYRPAEDSYLLEKIVKKYAKNKSFLDIGAGSGIQSKAALESGAKSILAVDINPEAVQIIKNKDIKVKLSNLFSNVKGKFDLIAFNPPYLPADKYDKEKDTTGGKKGDETILKFLKQVKKHLEKKGKILLLVSSLTPRNRINALISKLGFKCKIATRHKLFMETLEVLCLE